MSKSSHEVTKKRANATLRMAQAELLQYNINRKDTATVASVRNRLPDIHPAAIRRWHLRQVRSV